LSQEPNQKTIKQSAILSLVLHFFLFALMWTFRSNLRSWTPMPSVYQVELVSVARSASVLPETTGSPATPPAPVPVDAVAPEVSVKKSEPPKPDKKPEEKKKEAKKPEAKKSEEKKSAKKEPVPPKIAENQPQQPAGTGASVSGVATGDSAITGTNRMKIEISNFPFAYYLNILKFRIQENWRPPPGRSKRETAVVGFTISRQGKISKIVLEKSSGKHHFDQAAQRAVHYADPLPPLPSDFIEDFLSVHIEFEGL
jgi:TonB family protein